MSIYKQSSTAWHVCDNCGKHRDMHKHIEDKFTCPLTVSRVPRPPFTPRRPRAPAELLKGFIVQVRTIEPGGTAPSKDLITIGHFSALTITGAIVQASGMCARNKIEICEVVATPE